MDLDIHNNNGVYEYKIHRKNAITNVQVKPHSGHDPKVLRGIFTGFLHRAYTVCEGQHREEEVDFLIRCFTENGYRHDELHRIVRQFKKKRETNNIQQLPEQEQPNTIVTLPWVPGLSPKLRRTFKKHGYKAVFKGSTNLKTLLTFGNKSKLPYLSKPGVYMVECNCGKKYVGETKLNVQSRIAQHQKTVKDEKWETTGIPLHAEYCKAGFNWDDTRILKTEERRFDRKVREALEIQLQDTAPRSEHGLNQDDGQYVTTKFWKPMFSYLRHKSLD